MSTQQRPRILIVEDDSKVAKGYQRVLEQIGDSMVVEDSTQVFEKIEDFKPQAILLDLQLEGAREAEPRRAGLQILKRLKDENSSWQNVPVIVITGSIEPDIEGKCKDLGVAEFFRKPIPIAILREAVRKHTQVE